MATNPNKDVIEHADILIMFASYVRDVCVASAMSAAWKMDVFQRTILTLVEGLSTVQLCGSGTLTNEIGSLCRSTLSFGNELQPTATTVDGEDRALQRMLIGFTASTTVYTFFNHCRYCCAEH